LELGITQTYSQLFPIVPNDSQLKKNIFVIGNYPNFFPIVHNCSQLNKKKFEIGNNWEKNPNYSQLQLGINWELGNWAYTSRQ
jgi:hypothetical protein